MEPEKKQNSWFSVTVTADPVAEMAVDTAFGILDSGGTEIDSLGKKETKDIKIVGYFEYEPLESEVEKVIYESIENFGLDRSLIREIAFEPVQEADWLAEWKKHWKPTHIGSFVITPPWEETGPQDGKHVISIEPSMAFGTGTHETTRLCIQLIEKHYRDGMSFLDVGTGTGILSIAAAKLAKTRTHFFACDVDEDSVKIAKENAVLNGVPEIVFEDGSISSGTRQSDFVCANLTIDVILPILSLLIEKTASVLVLSGVLVEQEEMLCRELKRYGYEPFEVIRDGEWIAPAIKKS